MARVLYFGECNGQPVRLANPYHDGSWSRAAKAFRGRCDAGHDHQVTRIIEYKPNPSRHACDARCLNATGKVMRCECSCGGKNHGRGLR